MRWPIRVNYCFAVISRPCMFPYLQGTVEIDNKEVLELKKEVRLINNIILMLQGKIT